jgi:hypothetical protein
MKTTLKLTAFAWLLAGSSLLGDPAPQPQIEISPGTASTMNADWQGVAGRTYFFQCSFDLESWMYAPFMEFSTGMHQYGFSSTAPKAFVRLKYVDADWVTTLQQAKDADFDQDGIPNWFEVETVFSDPLDGESAGGDTDNGGSGDGLADGWELYYFGATNIADPNAALEADGLTNKEKSELGLDPNVDYSDPTATQTAQYIYDLTGRLTGVTAPVAAATFTPDEEGNILNAQ